MLLVSVLLLSCGGLVLCGALALLVDEAATVLFQGPERAEAPLREDAATA